MLAAGVPCANAGVKEASQYYEDAVRRFAAGDLAGTIVQLKNSIKQNRQQVAAHLFLGKVYNAKGSLRDAQAAYQEALQQGADRSEVAVPLARIDLSLNEPKLALAAVEGARFPPSLRVEALAIRGAAYTMLNDRTSAARTFDEALALDPNSVVTLLAQGEFFMRAGQTAQARAAAEKSVSLEPGNARAWTMEAVALRAAGDAKASLAAFDKAVQLSPPDQIEARLGRAALLIDLGRATDAQADIADLVKRAPKSLRVLTLQGVTSRMRGDEATAKTAFSQAIGLIDSLPPSALSANRQDLMMAAIVHHELGEQQKALALTDTLLERYPDSAAAQMLKATIYLEMHDYVHAQPLIDSMRRSNRDDPQLLYQQGIANLGLGRNAQAVTALEAALPRIDTPPVRRALGLAQVRAGMEAQGMVNLEKSFTAAHDIETARTLTAMYIARGQPKRALETAEAVLKQSPRSAPALTLRGEVKASLGDAKGARDDFAGVISESPAFGPAQVDMARLDFAEGHVDAARNRLQAMAVKGNDPEVSYQLGRLEQQAGHVDAAVQQLRKAADGGSIDASFALVDLLLRLQRADEALTAANDFVQKRPRDLRARLTLARAEIAGGKLPAARSDLRDATVAAGYDADLQVQIGRLRLAAGNVDDATYNAQKAMEGHADDMGAMILNVDIAIASGDVQKADQALKALSQRYPGRLETLLSKANVEMAGRRYANAVSTLDQALSLSRTSDIALLRGSADVMGGRPGAAASFYADWMTRHPRDGVVLAALAEAQFQSGQLVQARKNYQTVLAASSQNPRLQNNYASLLLAMGDAAHARPVAQVALAADPKNPAIMDTLGWSMVLTGDAAAGLPYLREARLRNPENAEIRTHLVAALARSGNQADARDELRSLLRQSPAEASTPAVVKLKAELGL